jgi:prolyl oligopeptidase
VGDNQSQDKLIFEDPTSPQSFNITSTSEDESFTFLSRSDRGKGLDGNSLFYIKKGEHSFKPIVPNISDFDYSIIDNYGDDLIITTTEDAPNKKVMAFNIATGKWRTLIPETKNVLQNVSSAGGKLFVTYMVDVTIRAYVYTPDGKMEREIKLPGLGNASGFGGERSDKFVFYTFSSFTYPSSIYRYDIASGKSTLSRKSEIAVNLDDYETHQVFYSSKDGTKIPMFIVYKKDFH